MSDDRRLTAFQIHPHANMDLTPAGVDRDWMDAADQRHPYRCLPLNIANQNGWFLSCPTDFRIFWYGGAAAKDLDVEFLGHKDPSITSHFGSGVLTFSIPYLFRTPEGINLWVKGPANMPKDGVVALEGIVETDWATSTFTMNWKVTRPFEWIRFRVGDPICHLLPIPRGLTESMRPEVRSIHSNPDLKKQYETWEEGRAGFLKGLKAHDPETVARGWQKDYFQGKTQDGQRVEHHQTRLDVRDFRDEPAS